MRNTNSIQNVAASPATPSTDASPLLIKRGELPGSPAAHQFIGAEHGALPISLFLVDDRPGAGPLLHRHPYPELFIVHAGRAEFEIDGTRLAATAGDILIAPAGTAHRFTNTGEKRLCITAIHTAPTMDTEWLEPSIPLTGARANVVDSDRLTHPNASS
ncbi:MAG: cupin domain-containing protein [Solirubrobacteraceae bacterium]